MRARVHAANLLPCASNLNVPLCCSKRVTTSEMGITNGIDIFPSHSGGVSVMTSNNDNVVRVFDAETFQCQRLVSPTVIVDMATVLRNLNGMSVHLLKC